MVHKNPIDWPPHVLLHTRQPHNDVQQQITCTKMSKSKQKRWLLNLWNNKSGLHWNISNPKVQNIAPLLNSKLWSTTMDEDLMMLCCSNNNLKKFSNMHACPHLQLYFHPLGRNSSNISILPFWGHGLCDMGHYWYKLTRTKITVV
jgi:hypothetical protein